MSGIMDDTKPDAEAQETNAARMSFGDHLDELRSCIIRALIGVVIATGMCLAFGDTILEIVYRPLNVLQHETGMPTQLQALSPQGPFTSYLKVAILSGLVVSAPWVLLQVWSFVAVGLYPRERRFAKLLAPISLGLFAAGVAFLYFLVLPIVLGFFLRFNATLAAPTFEPVASQTTDTPVGRIPILGEDPLEPEIGDAWVNVTTNELKIETERGTLVMSMERREGASAIRSQFALDFYISFVLMLALAFGIAFELPIVVYFLAWTGIVSIAQMASARRYVFLGTVVASAMLTPPDVISQVLLAGPMYLLFELGLVAARLTQRKRAD